MIVGISRRRDATREFSKLQPHFRAFTTINQGIIALSIKFYGAVCHKMAFFAISRCMTLQSDYFEAI